VVFAGGDGIVRCLDAGSGREKWSHEAGGEVDSSPVIAGERVWVGSSGGDLYALDLETGTVEWRFRSGAAIAASPAFADGRLVIGSGDGAIYCFAGE
jgi:outer membrane protein assembly factor BamB